jgi:hypothetical protein
MAEMVYAVHTRTCTYLLDEEGVCGWVTSPSGSQAQDRCIGAQFVACLDLSVEGGLVGELRVGAAGLFARRENGRFVLLKTSEIERVEYRRAGAYLQQGGATQAPPLVPVAPVDPRLLIPTNSADPDTLRMAHHVPAMPAYAPPPPPAYPAPAPRWPAAAPEPPPYARPTDHRPPAYVANAREEYRGPSSLTSPDGESISADEYAQPVSMDMEELSTYTGEVTLSLPLYRPEHEEQPLPWEPPPAPLPQGWHEDDLRRRR